MFLQLRKVDPVTRKVIELYIEGTGVKALGYLVIAVGILTRSVETMLAGILTVAIGWVMICKAYRLSKT